MWHGQHQFHSERMELGLPVNAQVAFCITCVAHSYVCARSVQLDLCVRFHWQPNFLLAEGNFAASATVVTYRICKTPLRISSQASPSPPSVAAAGTAGTSGRQTRGAALP